MKKKKRIDPTIELNRLRRKTRKIEKEIKRFTKQDRQLRPITEIEGDRQMLREIEHYIRPPTVVSEDELDRRVTLLKEWSKHQLSVSLREQRLFSRVLKAQQRALEWLYLTSPDLYRAAIQPCPTILEEKTTNGGQELSPNSDGKPEGATLSIGEITGPWYSAPRVHGNLVDCPESEYDPPDGEIHDTTPVFHYDFELDRQFLAEPPKKK